ncbi:MAG: hypothetical protein ACMXYC_03095 [Candidatus Woesearchaeota archaeon]
MEKIIAMCLTALFLVAACAPAVVPEEQPIQEPPQQPDFEPAVADTRPEEEQQQEVLLQLVEDGTYEDEVTYRYHSGTETMIVTVSIENDIITGIGLQGIDSHPTSANLIAQVHEALPDLVVGKRIDEVDIPARIGGSSLTAQAVKQHLENFV